MTKKENFKKGDLIWLEPVVDEADYRISGLCLVLCSPARKLIDARQGGPNADGPDSFAFYSWKTGKIGWSMGSHYFKKIV